MRLYNRIIALLATVFLTLSAVLPVSAEEADGALDSLTETEVQSEEVNPVNKEQQRRFNIIKSLGLLEGTDMEDAELDTVFTRAQYAEVVCSVFKYAKKEAPKDLVFTDIPQDHKYYGAVASLNAVGSMKGVSDTLFLPDENLLYEDAVKVLVSMLGYEEIAQNSGGYPIGYMVTAQKIDLVDNFDRMSANITVGDLADLFYNLLEVRPLELTGIKNGVAYYKTAEDENFMSQYWDIYKTRGILNAIYLSEFGGAPSVKSDEIAVDGVIYDNCADGAEKYFAYSVTVYYREKVSDVTRTALYVEDNSKIPSLTIPDEDTTYENNTYTYYEDGRKCEAQISPDAEIFYNGKRTKYHKELMVPQNGEVTLVDNDGTGDYNAVLIKNYATAIISTTEQDTYTILMKNYVSLYTGDDTLLQENVNTLVLDSKKCNAHIYDPSLAEKSFLELGGNMIISVAVSLDKSIIDLRYGTQKVVGTVSSLDDKKVVIGEKEYDVVYGLLGKNQLSVGLTGEFYLDFRGRIVWSVTAENSQPIGVFIKAGMTSGGMEKPNIMFLDAVSKEKKIYELDSKLIIDGISYPATNETELAQIVRRLRRSMVIDGKEYLSYNLVYIDVNTDGIVKKVYTANSDRYENFRVVNTGESGYDSAEVAISAETVGDRGIFDENTLFIYMPYVAAENADWLSVAEHYIFFRNKWMIGNAIGKFVDFYYTDDDSCIDVLIRYGIQLKESMLSDAKNPDFILPPAITENVGVVKSISNGIDEEGNIISIITFIRSDGKEQTEKTNTRYSLDSKETGSIGGEGLEPGDVFSYYRANDVIGNFCKMYDCSEPDIMEAFHGVPLGYVDLYNMYPGNVIPPDKKTASAGVYKSSFRATVGTVYEVKSDSFYVALGNTKDDSDLAVFKYKGQTVIICDTKRDNKVDTGSLADMRGLKHHGDEASRVLVYTKDGKNVAYFVYI